MEARIITSLVVVIIIVLFYTWGIKRKQYFTKSVGGGGIIGSKEKSSIDLEKLLDLDKFFNIFGDVGEAMVEAVDKAVEVVGEAAEDALEAGEDAIEAVDDAAKDSIRAFDNAGKGVGNAIDNAWNALSSGWKNIFNNRSANQDMYPQSGAGWQLNNKEKVVTLYSKHTIEGPYNPQTSRGYEGLSTYSSESSALAQAERLCEAQDGKTSVPITGNRMSTCDSGWKCQGTDIFNKGEVYGTSGNRHKAMYQLACNPPPPLPPIPEKPSLQLPDVEWYDYPWKEMWTMPISSPHPNSPISSPHQGSEPSSGSASGGGRSGGTGGGGRSGGRGGGRSGGRGGGARPRAPFTPNILAKMAGKQLPRMRGKQKCISCKDKSPIPKNCSGWISVLEAIQRGSIIKDIACVNVASRTHIWITTTDSKSGEHSFWYATNDSRATRVEKSLSVKAIKVVGSSDTRFIVTEDGGCYRGRMERAGKREFWHYEKVMDGISDISMDETSVYATKKDNGVLYWPHSRTNTHSPKMWPGTSDVALESFTASRTAGLGFAYAIVDSNLKQYNESEYIYRFVDSKWTKEPREAWSTLGKTIGEIKSVSSNNEHVFVVTKTRKVFMARHSTSPNWTQIDGAGDYIALGNDECFLRTFTNRVYSKKLYDNDFGCSGVPDIDPKKLQQDLDTKYDKAVGFLRRTGWRGEGPYARANPCGVTWTC
uniref:Uncharacterized protein n=1 Tax=viral metagenome TaxID=1070528 RepID=A0A6C0KE86_9ZZZZ